MDFLSNIVQQVITVLYNMTATVGLPNYGLAIIIMTIIVKILLYPLTKKQIESSLKPVFNWCILPDVLSLTVYLYFMFYL